MTKFRWSFQHSFWLTANIYPIDNPAHSIIFDIKRETLASGKLFNNLTVYKKYPEPHLSQHDTFVLWELMETADLHTGTHTGYYIQEIKKIVQNKSNWKSSFLVVPEFTFSWWCQHLFFITGGASFLPFTTDRASNFCKTSFRCPHIL